MISWRFPGMTREEVASAPDNEGGFKLGRKVFDNAGNLILVEELGEDNQVLESEEMGYDSAGRMVSKVHRMDGEITENLSFEYDAAGNLISERNGFAQGGEQLTNYSYDDSGKLILKVISDEDGNEEGREILNYEGDNLMLQETVNETGEKTSSITFIYKDNAEGKSLSEEIEERPQEGIFYRTVYDGGSVITYDRKGSKVSAQLRKYDEKGQLVETRISTLQRDVTIFYEYDEKGNLVREERLNGGHPVFLARNFYDEAGNLVISEVTEAGSGLVTDRFEYVFQDQES